MTLTKKDMISRLNEEMGLATKAATESTELIIEIIKSTLEAGEEVMISGFGKFCLVHKNQRQGRNPATGDDMMLPPRTVVTFKCSGSLRDRMNGNKNTKL